MKDIFKVGELKSFDKVVTESDAATFDEGNVHPVYATFSLARDAEWTCRLFVLEMKEADEEGIGTFINVKHHSPALIGEKVQFTAKIKSIEGNAIICSYEAKVHERLIATGEQGQKILKKDRIKQLFEKIENERS